ncbi:hypothetical protein [Halarchaeum grantii]|uniref:hypothetical protein n=1 Tax=Halarchaeum grantii TaxID=1193105 RepID=UPI00166468D2|nr:hypothetical protein [Halarchaeum grantii]
MYRASRDALLDLAATRDARGAVVGARLTLAGLAWSVDRAVVGASRWALSRSP